jgi:predicted Holliday junction resolvase-like endonuclease
MTINPIDLALGILIGALAVWVYVLLWKVGYTRRVRDDAVQRSLAVTAGKVHEQLIPYLPGFPYPRTPGFSGVRWIWWCSTDWRRGGCGGSCSWR